jgi:hypothetical protein
VQPVTQFLGSGSNHPRRYFFTTEFKQEIWHQAFNL